MIRWAAINTITDALPAVVPPLGNNGAHSRPLVDLLKHALSRQSGRR
jgi:hypothetical protein